MASKTSRSVGGCCGEVGGWIPEPGVDNGTLMGRLIADLRGGDGRRG